ncbi:MAG: penicillin-binding protein 2 [Chloroflexi bacterium]|nr:penicillin-binding protein 2 [Chloroflexota bacterium]
MIHAWRLRATIAAMGLLLAVFIGRLFSLQILQGELYSNLADDNRFDRVSLPAPRGVIYDSNGSLLVRNLPAFNIYVTPALLPDSEAEIEAIYIKLADLTGVPLDQPGPPAAPCVGGRGIRQLVEEGATNRPFDAWPVACDIDETTARVLRQQQIDMPGVSVEAVPVREYPTGNLTSAVIGYLGPIPAAQVDFWESLGFLADRDKVGYGGVELNYQDILAGQNGLKLVEKDVAGSLLAEVGPGNSAVPGNNLKLTIDTRLQAITASALENRMEFLNRFAGEVRTTIGSVIAMNPQTGEILAMVSIPSYENNRLARFIPQYYFRQLSEDASRPLINHAISSEFPPGSSFKMVTAVGALNEGVIDPKQTLFDPGQITIQNAYFPNDPGQAKEFVCWKEDGHGQVDFIHGIAWSCNVYFYKIGGGFEDEVSGKGLGIDDLGVYARALGYGAPLGIDLPGEEDGLIPTEEWKRLNLGESWSTGDTYISAVGQGFVRGTPLQVLTSVSTIANGGRVMWPHVVQEVLDGEGNVVHRYEPCVLWDIADGILMEDTSEIAAGCDSLDPELRENIIAGHTVSPDITVAPGVLELAREGMRLVVEDEEGTANPYALLDGISSGGKTGTGEFCDETAFSRNLCVPGNWPTHSWYTAFAPYENPEIAVVAFVYNGGEGAVTAGPIVKQVIEAYFELKAIDAAR